MIRPLSTLKPPELMQSPSKGKQRLLPGLQGYHLLSSAASPGPSAQTQVLTSSGCALWKESVEATARWG